MVPNNFKLSNVLTWGKTLRSKRKLCQFHLHPSLVFTVQAYRVKYQKNLAHWANNMNFGIKVPKTKENSLVWRAWVKFHCMTSKWLNHGGILHMTSLWCHMYEFAGTLNQTFLSGLRNLHIIQVNQWTLFKVQLLHVHELFMLLLKYRDANPSSSTA